MRHGGSHRGCARTNATLRLDSNRIPRARHSQKAKQLRIPERKKKQDDAQKKHRERERERESLTDKHARARAHPAVERTTQLIFTLSSARRKETQLYHQGKKKVEKNKGISERFLVSFILLVIFFPCSCGILVQFYTTLELICPQIFQAYRERERERIRGALR